MNEPVHIVCRLSAGRHPRVAVVFQRFGPYHISRLEAAAKRMTVIGVELSATDRTYAWTAPEPSVRFQRRVVSPDIDAEPVPRLLAKVTRTLARIRPDAVAIAGWSHPGALAALLWCALNHVPAVLMSDSAADDAVRRPWREAVKRRIVSLFASAVVGGTPHRNYLAELGMPVDAIFDGLDVVDNEHFAKGAAYARANANALRQHHALPARYFLTSSRMIGKKNLFAILEAYRLYRAEAGAEPWDLVMLGDGRLMPSIRDAIARAELNPHVQLPGFRQYDELPTYYGLAGAFILASTTEQWGLVVNEAMASGLPVLVSTRCGCSGELVRPGVSGFAFDPRDPTELAGLMQTVASDPSLAASMAAAGRDLIAGWSPDRFAEHLLAAVEHAQAAQRRPGLAALGLAGLSLFRRERPDD
jgi:1,2-diacylglycerol 3-alpha-glucosyltransferase